VNRRELITLAGGAAAGSSIFRPMMAWAQQPERMRRIGVLMAGSDDADGQARIAAFRQGLQEFGWREGRNVAIDIRWGGGGNDGIRSAAAVRRERAGRIAITFVGDVTAVAAEQDGFRFSRRHHRAERLPYR
jgi:hypothetical protein